MDALVVANTPTHRRVLTDVLTREKFNCIVCSTAAEARRASLCRPFDLFVVYSGLPDEHGNELAISLARSNDCGGVYIDDDARNEHLSDELNAYGIITLTNPVAKSALLDAVRLLIVSNARVRELKKRIKELNVKLEDAKYINRAKVILMRSLGYTEEKAHHTIESRAMEQRVPRRKIAQDIIATYEDI